MIDWYFGKPRTGKTYKAVKYIYDNYILNDAPDYKNILTNINGFDFKSINNNFLERGSFSLCYHLVWVKFYKHLQKMYDMAIAEKSDEELNKYADYHKINDCLIVIDEAFRFMKKYDAVISWYLAYHGHFRVKLIFISQSPKQIYAEYLSHTEIFYEAQSQLRRLSDNKITYFHYDEPPSKYSSKFSSDSIKTSPEVFSLYKSGEVDRPKKVIYKYIAFAVVALIFTIYSFYNLFDHFSPPPPDSDDIVTISSNSNDFYSSDNFMSTNTFILNIRCDDSYCWNVDNKFFDNQITIKYFTNIVDTFNLKLNFYEVKNEIYRFIHLNKSIQKISLASFTDFYYEVPYDLKKTYLSTLFIPKQVKKETLSSYINSNNSNSAMSEERLSDE